MNSQTKKEQPKIEEPEDLQLEVAKNPENAFWINTKKKAENLITEGKHELEINEIILKGAIKKIDETGGDLNGK